METLVSLFIGAFMPPFIKSFKKRGLTGKQAHLVLAIFLAGLYTAYQIFAPIPLKESVFAFITQASVTAVVVYEVFLKKQDTKKEQSFINKD